MQICLDLNLRRWTFVLIACAAACGTAAWAATTITLSLPDDTNSLAKYGCERDGATCSAPAAKAWLEAQVDSRVLAEIRAQRAADALGRKPAFCALFNAAPAAARNNYCADIREAPACTPPQCQ